MRKRITYVQRPEAPFEREQTTLTTSTLSVRDLDAAREERVTLSFNELPVEVRIYHSWMLVDFIWNE